MAKKKTATPPANETPAQRFTRLASVRVGKALHAIGLIGHLSGKTYESNETQRAKIEDALTEAVAAVAEKLASKSAASAPKFEL